MLFSNRIFLIFSFISKTFLSIVKILKNSFIYLHILWLIKKFVSDFTAQINCFTNDLFFNLRSVFISDKKMWYIHLVLSLLFSLLLFTHSFIMWKQNAPKPPVKLKCIHEWNPWKLVELIERNKKRL